MLFAQFNFECCPQRGMTWQLIWAGAVQILVRGLPELSLYSSNLFGEAVGSGGSSS